MTYLNALPAVESRFGSSTSTYSVIAAGYTIAGVRTPPDGPTRKSKPRPCIVLAQSSLNRRLRTLTIELGGSLRHLFRTGRLLKIYVNIECENERRRCVVCRVSAAWRVRRGCWWPRRRARCTCTRWTRPRAATARCCARTRCWSRAPPSRPKVPRPPRARTPRPPRPPHTNSARRSPRPRSAAGLRPGRTRFLPLLVPDAPPPRRAGHHID